MAPPDQHQVDIFSNDLQQLQYAELCNALYERELMSLAHSTSTNASLLKRRLSGLSYHIKRAAEHLLQNSAPIQVDTHNASWQSKQAAKCMVNKVSNEKTALWYQQHIKIGIAVPVYLNEMGIEYFELDSIDRIDANNQTFHVNKHGWFHFSGKNLQDDTQDHFKKLVLQPTKGAVTAACCGHSWNHKGRSQPRSLSLREILLSTTINWKTFA
jgi:hypothetical protein